MLTARSLGRRFALRRRPAARRLLVLLPAAAALALRAARSDGAPTAPPAARATFPAIDRPVDAPLEHGYLGTTD